MPKKTENTKAVAARERKKNAKEAEIARKQKEEEDAYWKDDDKQVLKKQQKKEEQERKRQEQLKKKAEAKALLEKEQATIVKSAKAPPPPKITRAQIERQQQLRQRDEEKKKDTPITTHLDAPLVENVNRLTIDGDEARTVSEAIAVLSNSPEEVDKHPEKRMKAAYTAFEERRLKELKVEMPELKLSQMKQLIWKEWGKSPENPLNQN
ncbi:coiled-coil domain-containing protein 124 [Aethina tumida]|uniref:coiled-coil domain-containing protein 124 n=1 Tax=Aethina tumida TaxID=116153 RepID=UPI00096B4E99|nr:coiled-coil domain-containing protein 124 [Aethina tumida]